MHSGEMSPQAKQKLRTAVDWLYCSAKEKWSYSKTTNKYHKWKLNFITLTLPTQSGMNDKQVKSILNSWLMYAKTAYGLRSYVWRAEAQKNGNIHFHITSDCYIWKTSLQHSWNRLLKKNNLLNGHENPPSTKIHSVYKIKNMAAYLVKYFSKPQHESRIIQGRLWGCSQTLSSIKPFKHLMERRRAATLHENYRKECVKEISNEYVTTYLMPATYYGNTGDPDVEDWYNATRASVRKKRYLHQFEIYGDDGKIIEDKNIVEKIIVDSIN